MSDREIFINEEIKRLQAELTSLFKEETTLRAERLALGKCAQCPAPATKKFGDTPLCDYHEAEAEREFEEDYR